MSWATGPPCSFDVESTGTNPHTARIVTATVLRIHGGATQAELAEIRIERDWPIGQAS